MSVEADPEPESAPFPLLLLLLPTVGAEYGVGGSGMGVTERIATLLCAAVDLLDEEWRWEWERDWDRVEVLAEEAKSRKDTSISRACAPIEPECVDRG